MQRGNLVGILIVLCIATHGILRKCSRMRNASYVYGIVTENYIGAKGTYRVAYDFYLNGIKYHNSAPKRVFEYCDYHCCDVGDTIIVRYKKYNPKNNDIVKKIP